MPVFESRISIPPDVVDAVETMLAEREHTGWMVFEQTVEGLAWLAGFFESLSKAEAGWSALAVDLRALVEVPEPLPVPVADQDWKESYKAHFKAWQSGRVHWVPVWERETYSLPEGHVSVWLDPGMAFGTGNHETTRLCLGRLTQFASQLETEGTDPSNVSLIDAGCGSGILAISAVVLGFRPVFGFDLDPEAIRASRANAALNGVADRIVFEEADLEAGLRGRAARIVLANIQADILMLGRGALLGAVVKNGRLVMSGMLAGESDGVGRAFSALMPGSHLESCTMGEWADLLLVRPG